MKRSSGFTLVEMIMVIVITGIIGGMVAVFLKAPVQQYMDVARRADITDIADTALRRVTRDLRLALPNSVRRTGACSGGATICLIEFLPTGSPSCAANTVCMGGGRYRAGAGGTNDELRFDIADNSFEVLGLMPTMVAGATPDQIVVYNLGIAGADAYAGSNRAAVAAVPAGAIANIAATQFPFDSPDHRFHVISTPISYACDGTGTLWRYWGYAIQAGQPASIAALNGLAGVQTARLANNITDCRFTYEANVVAQRTGLVTLRLAITRDNETVTLYSATHVSNQP
ncbi:MAG: prepilin-type N-terminal cleavage/methylation domain-containing protein [Gallionella sp.]